MIKTERVEKAEKKKENDLRWTKLNAGDTFIFVNESSGYRAGLCIVTDGDGWMDLGNGTVWNSGYDSAILRATPVNPYKYTVEEA